MILSDLELTLPHAASARDGLRPRSLTELLGRRDEPHLWFGLGRRRAPRDRHPACARRRRTSSCTPSRSFGRPSASLLPSRVSCETFGGRLASRLVPVGFFGRPHARKRRSKNAFRDLERPCPPFAVRRFRAREPPTHLVAGAPRAGRPSSSSVLWRTPIRSASTPPRFRLRRRTSNCRLTSASVGRPPAALPLALAAELQDVGLTALTPAR